MLRLKSFKFDQSEEMNTLLDTYRLAQGAHVFVSDGLIIIPYEDGEPKTDAQKIIDVKEQKNIILGQMDIIDHSQQVLVHLKEDAVRRVNEAKADLAEAEQNKGKEKYDAVKDCTDILKQAENALRDVENQYKQNTIEMVRLQLNCELFDEKIDELSA